MAKDSIAAILEDVQKAPSKHSDIVELPDTSPRSQLKHKCKDTPDDTNTHDFTPAAFKVHCSQCKVILSDDDYNTGLETQDLVPLVPSNKVAGTSDLLLTDSIIGAAIKEVVAAGANISPNYNASHASSNAPSPITPNTMKRRQEDNSADISADQCTSKCCAYTELTSNDSPVSKPVKQNAYTGASEKVGASKKVSTLKGKRGKNDTTVSSSTSLASTLAIDISSGNEIALSTPAQATVMQPVCASQRCVVTYCHLNYPLIYSLCRIHGEGYKNSAVIISRCNA